MSKKDEAFRLFGEGKRPSDPEVKALGLRAKTRYNYFQEYKKSRGASDNGANDFDDIAELKKEKARLSLLTQIDELETKRAKLPDKLDKMEAYLDALVEYLGEVVDQIETLASCDLSMIIQLHTGGSEAQSLENWDNWSTFRKALAANESLGKLDPIPERLRKLKPKDL